MTDNELRNLGAIQPFELLYVIKNNNLKDYTRACCVSYLGLSSDLQIISHIKEFSLDESPLVREGSFQALANIYIEFPEECEDFFNYFENCLKKETSEGVKSQIKSSLELMNLYKE